MDRRLSFVLAAFAAGVSVTAFGKAWSLNQFAVNKVVSSSTNTIVCIPWSGYATNEPPQLAINKLVNSHGLKQGDQMLSCITNEVGAYRYDAWEFQEATHSWKQIHVVERYNEEGQGLDPYGVTNGVLRGSGLWVVRKSGGDLSVPIYLHGQYATNPAPVKIAGGTAEVPSVRMLANPDFTAAQNVNDMLDWTTVGVSEEDWLSLPSASKAIRQLHWDSGNHKWYISQKTVKTEGGKTKVYSENVTEGPLLSVPAGTGFWYVRRVPGDIEVTFPKPSFAEN